MDAADSWGYFSAPSRRHQSRYDQYLAFDESDVGSEEDSFRGVEYPCPFCYEDFDIIGLCCHIDDEHPVEAKNGVCPVCLVRFGTDMVAHITMEHENFYKMQRRRKYRKGSPGTHSSSFFRKELQEDTLQSLLGGSSYTVAPSSGSADPLLSSFINLPKANSSKHVQPESLDEEGTIKKISGEKTIESMESSISDKDQKERIQRSEFVQGLIMSTIFDDSL